MLMNKRVVVVAAIGLSIGTGLAIVGKAAMLPQQFGPSPLRDGNPADTMARARVLLSALRRAQWDVDKVEPALLRVPDQSLAKSQLSQARDTFAVRLPSDVYGAEVAFYSDLYVQIETVRKPGVEGVGSQRGFWIVGWKDGRVTQVPVGTVRTVDYVWRGHKIGLYVFPGMKQYVTAKSK